MLARTKAELKDLAEVGGTGPVAPFVEKAALALERADNYSRVFLTIPNVESMDDGILRGFPTEMTALKVIAEEFRKLGFQVGETVGGLMNLGFTREQIHEIACACNGTLVTGQVAALRLREAFGF